MVCKKIIENVHWTFSPLIVPRIVQNCPLDIFGYFSTCHEHRVMYLSPFNFPNAQKNVWKCKKWSSFCQIKDSPYSAMMPVCDMCPSRLEYCRQMKKGAKRRSMYDQHIPRISSAYTVQSSTCAALKMAYVFQRLNPRSVRAFFIMWTFGGEEAYTTPPRISKLNVKQLSGKKTADRFRQVLAIKIAFSS